MKNEFKNELIKRSTLISEEEFKETLKNHMFLVADERYDFVEVSNETRMHMFAGHRIPCFMLEKPNNISFDTVKTFFPDDDFIYQQEKDYLVISWKKG